MLQQITPFFGYLASLLLILALLVNNDLKFRWYNTFGNIAFIIYAIVLQAFPVLLTNCILFSINVYYLVKIYSRKELFDLIEFQGDEKLAWKFLDFYSQDISDYFPAFNREEIKGNFNFVITRNIVIANMFSATLLPNGDAEVLINYTVEKYRDLKVGRFIFEREKEYLLSRGIQRIIYKRPVNKKHGKFLEVMGFTRQLTDGRTSYVKALSSDTVPGNN